jgi:hypothetical protein
MPKPVCPNMATATALGPTGAESGSGYPGCVSDDGLGVPEAGRGRRPPGPPIRAGTRCVRFAGAPDAVFSVLTLALEPDDSRRVLAA